ncbi:MAG: alpha/beta fold hydrolase, partial [Candidatus Hydrogenedentes bacterium]|nr:alpha/beta fold hydrolase [Candidatus Hydrogenedentota bacterium]
MRDWIRRRGLVILGAVAVAIVVLGTALASYAREDALGPVGQYFDSAGVPIHYTDEGEGTPVVLVHGFGNPANLQWRRNGQIAALRKHYRVIALDNRGHGRSGKPHDPEAYGVEMVKDLVRLLDHLGLERAHIVGYSMGGFIALKMVAMYPDRILSAAACAAGWEQDTPENREFAQGVARAVLRGETGPLAQRLGIRETGSSYVHRLEVWAAISWFNDPRALSAVALGSRQLTLTEAELRANSVPTLTIIGSEDGLLPDAQALHAVMANHEVIV